MRSSRPKALHEVAGRSMLGHVVAAVTRAGASQIAVVVGPDREDMAREVMRLAPGARVFIQHERLGTAHALLSAREALAGGADDILVAYADTPLMGSETFERLRAPLAEGAAVVALGFEARDPTGYGRFLQRGGQLAAIREHRDASPEERAITLCNAGLMALRGDVALAILDRIGNDNAKREYYLTDAVEVARSLGHRTVAVTAPEEEVQGVNDRAQLAAVEADMQRRLRAAALASGVTLVAPETVFFSYDTRIGRDTIVEPHVVFGPGVVVEEDVVIHAFSHLEGAHVGANAEVGPYARLRPGADLGERSKVGNFVEVKKAKLGKGAKANHLTYLGDAEVGANANVGAGTITCNYDGFFKYKTVIGDGAFIGSNSALVAPVSIGAGAIVGAGSTVTCDVPPDSLRLVRPNQTDKLGWASRFRTMMAAKKKGA